MKKVLGYFPDLKYERKNFNYLKDDEINVIKMLCQTLTIF